MISNCERHTYCLYENSWKCIVLLADVGVVLLSYFIRGKLREYNKPFHRVLTDFLFVFLHAWMLTYLFFCLFSGYIPTSAFRATAVSLLISCKKEGWHCLKSTSINSSLKRRKSNSILIFRCWFYFAQIFSYIMYFQLF